VAFAVHSAFEHPALLYRGDDDYLAAVTEFVFGGVMLGEPVMVAVPTRKLEMLQHAWGDAAGAVEMHDMTAAGRNPGRIIGDVLLNFVARHHDHHVRIVGEPIWAGRDATEYPACAQHEALINVALDDCPATILCPYDVTLLSRKVIADASRTHPEVWMDAHKWRSPDYDDPEMTASSFNLPLTPEPWSATSMSLWFNNIDESRRFTASWALASNLDLERVADTVLVVDELVTNAIIHGGGSGRLATWTENGRLVFEVSDHGHICDPLAGRRPTPPDQTHGRGLGIVHRMSDLVRVHTTTTGTQTRAYFLV
jgi:anti-sigma regulatory factor (Ser/Thr protein kinase)